MNIIYAETFFNDVLLNSEYSDSAYRNEQTPTYIKTLGFYTAGDGGAAVYKVVNNQFTTDWVNGTKLEALASRYFGDDRDAMTECCQAIYGKLVNSATWGLSTIQKLGIKEDNLSEEELQKMANLPAMIYYGVNSDEAILMRMNNVPRSVASEMGVEYKKDFDNIYKQSSYEIRQWIEGLSSDKWDVFAENKRGMSGSDYKAIWKVLNNET